MYKYIYDQVQIDEGIENTQDEELSLLSDECDIIWFYGV
jgi:hypothetical protein